MKLLSGIYEYNKQGEGKDIVIHPKSRRNVGNQAISSSTILRTLAWFSSMVPG